MRRLTSIRFLVNEEFGGFRCPVIEANWSTFENFSYGRICSLGYKNIVILFNTIFRFKRSPWCSVISDAVIRVLPEYRAQSTIEIIAEAR